MKTLIRILFLFVLLSGALFAQRPAIAHYKPKWSTNPFDPKFFIENKGQFNGSIEGNDAILFETQLGTVTAYFTNHSVIYKYDEYPKVDKAMDPDKSPIVKPKSHYLTAEWTGFNADVRVSGEKTEGNYYTYEIGADRTIKVNVFRKILYHNIYPGIDAEYVFPEGKDGLKYSLIVHPGADLSLVKLNYKGAKGLKLNENGEVIIRSKVGELTDHFPVSYYLNERGNVPTAYQLAGTEESFKISNYDKSKTLVIDPWTSNPGFAGGAFYNKGYDVDYDYQGNVYVYGGKGAPFQLTKLNSSGVVLWTFNTPNNFGFGSYYGDFAVDKTNGTSYLVEGFGGGSFARVLKINTNGISVGTFAGDPNINEMWRVVYDECNHNLVIGAGGTSATTFKQAALLDTAMTGITSVTLASPSNCCEDIALVALDPSSSDCYMLITHGAPYADNSLFKVPLPLLSPNTYVVPTGFGFGEVSSVKYVGSTFYGANGYNGMSASLNWLYAYDGDTIKRFNKGTGALSTYVPINTIPRYFNVAACYWGGLTVDACDNLYAGSITSINVYDPSLTLASTIALPDTVYDVVLGASYKKLYATGKGFVSSFDIPTAIAPYISKVRTPASCSCTGTAAATLMMCNSPATSAIYSWSSGETTQAISGLCPGIYTVTIMSGCSNQYTDTVKISSVGIHTPITSFKSQVTCNGSTSGNISLATSGGTTPYSYAWSAGGVTTATGTNLTPGTYSITVTDANGCSATTVAVISPPALTLNVTNADCSTSGSATAIVSGGRAPYTYNWSNGFLSTKNSGLAPGSYSVTITDANGCSATQSFAIINSGAASATFTQSPAGTVCVGDLITFTNTGTAGSSGVTWNIDPVSPAVTGFSVDFSYTFLNAGSYSVTHTVNDGGCTNQVISTIKVIDCSSLTATAAGGTICEGLCASVTSTPAGGTSPYTYVWSDASTTQNISPCPVLTTTYTVTVTDASSNTATATAVVTVNPAVNVSVSSGNVTCNAGSDGAAGANPGNGTPGYTYLWSNGATGQTATGLVQNGYTITVTDSKGCTATSTTSVTQPTAITTPAFVPVNASCGASTGSATATSSGGTGTLTYTWSNGASGQTATTLSANTYTVTVEDANGCSQTASVPISNSPAPTINSITQTPILCKGASTGAAVVSATGTGTLTYNWSTGSTLTTIGNQIAGNYTVTVSDAAGCQAITNITITEPATALSAGALTPTNATCGASNGSIILATPTGGTGSYTYLWSNAATSQNINSLAANGYTVTITDANGCTKTTNTTIVNSSGPNVSASVTAAISCYGGTGSVTATIVGGVANYGYSWSSGSSTITSSLSNTITVTANTYVVTITDANSCTATSTVILTEPSAIATLSITATNATCGNSNGSVTLSTPTGGTGAYTYLWSNGATSQNINSLSINGYSVTVSDANGCTKTANTSISNSGGGSVSLTASAINCNAGTGTITATATSSSSPYTYSWSNGTTATTTSASDQLSSASANNYTVTVTDASGCSATSTVNLTQPPAINFSASIVTDATCGNSNGSAIAAASGGSGSLTYSWNTTATGQTVNGLAANNYTVIVTDANGCTNSSTVTVANTGGPSISSVNPTNPLCSTGTGTAVASASGGAGSLTYSWSSSGTAATETGLTTGIYTVTVKDANACTATQTVTITVPNAISISASQNSASSCGNSDGVAVATIAAGGTGTFTYSWSNGASGLTANNLPAGVHTVTATDANGCTQTATATIINAGGPSITSVIGTNPQCSTGTGSAVASASGGSGTLTYSWSTTATGQTVSNLTSGIYSVTVTDAINCPNVSTVTITVPVGISSPAYTITNESCGKANGAVSATTSGGTGALTYSWSTTAAGQTISNLSAADYTVTVTDANGCSISSTVTIGSSSGPSINSVAPSNALCFGGVGTAQITISASTSPYTYSWSNGASAITTDLTSSVTNLTAKNYTVTVTDGNGCTSTSTTAITAPAAITFGVPVITNAGCGTSNGTAVVTASGGTGTIGYSWSTTATGQTVTGLAANIYFVTATDVNGCSASQAIQVNSSPGPTISSIVSTSILCNGAATGTATVAATGSAPLTYSWSSGSTAVSAGNLGAGTYTVVVTDADGCKANSIVTLSAPSTIAATLASTAASCGVANGSVSVNSLSGGTGALTYTWSTTATTSVVNNLPAGSYTLSVTDGNGCTKTFTTAVNNIGGPTITSIAQINPLCSTTTGSATASASGGAGTLTYTWSNGSTFATDNNLSAGTYTVSVTDANSCLSVSSVTITAPLAIVTGASQTSPATCGNSNGMANVSATGGTGAYTYSWSNGSTLATASGLGASTYTVNVTDANGCSQTGTVSIANTNGPTATTSVQAAINCNGGTGTAAVTVTAGVAPYTYSWSSGASVSTSSLTNSVGALPAATYTVTITDANSCSITSTVIITEPSLLSASASSKTATCGLSNGTAFAAATGGTINYTYSWSNGQTTDTIKNISASSYTVTITDVSGCTSTVVTTVNNIGAGVINIAPVAQTIIEGTSVAITVSGGVSYTWTPASGLSCTTCSNPVAIPSTSTIYTVTATDLNGCIITGELSINVKPACVGDDKDVFIANIFSPNGDGKNDVLRIEGNGLTNIYWAIYDRWGNLLFEAFDQTHPWDGTKNGNAMETGTYVYYLRATCIKTNTEVKLKGNVSIMK